MSEMNTDVAGSSASNSPLKQSEKLTQIKETVPTVLPSKEEEESNGAVKNSGPNGSLQVNGTAGPSAVTGTDTDPKQSDPAKKDNVETDKAKGAEGEEVKAPTEAEKKDEAEEGSGGEKEKDPSSVEVEKEENKEVDERKEEEMEVSQGDEPSGGDAASPKEKTSTRRRRTSMKTTPTKTPPSSAEDTPKKRGRSPAAETPQSEGRVKRQRKQVEKFQAPTATPEPPTPTSPASVRLYDKNATLAVRADGASFFLCRCMGNVTNTNRRFKIRWFEVEQDPDLYRLAYDDKVELECVIGPAHLKRAHRGLFRLVPSELERINQLLKAAERGEDVTKLDPELFKPQTSAPSKPSTSKTPENKNEKTDEVDAGDDTDELEDSEPTPKRKRTRKKTETPKPKATPKPRAAKGTPRPRASAKVATKSRSRKPKKVVSIAQAEPALRRTTTLNLARNLSLRRSGSFFNRPSLIKKLSLQKWPSLKVKAKRPKLAPGAKRPPRPPVDPNRKLRQNPRVTVWERDPLFESRVEVPFVSSLMHSRLAIRAIKLNDLTMLKKVCQDEENVHRVNIQRSLHCDKDTMALAVLGENKAMIQELYNETKAYRCRPAAPRVLLSTESTGSYNPRTLPGVKAVRKVQISRGGREGNNALTKDSSRSYYLPEGELALMALRNNVSFETIQTLIDLKIVSYCSIYDEICEAVRYGHRKLACQLMEATEKTGGYGFNFMHKESLKFDGEDFSGRLLEASAVKKPQDNKKMLPIHCAAINPNTKYLSTLLAISSDPNITDADKRRPVHYAAACEGTGPLELLIKRGVSLEEGDAKGWTPLIIACIAGRAENVKLILNHYKAKEQENASLGLCPRAQRFGPGGINRPMKSTWCPLHFAVANRRKEVISVLLEFGADVNKHLGANFNRITPLMMVAQDGDLDLVRFLIDHKAKIEKPDKLKRTALIHAVRDGNANVVSYLLNRGADPNTTDSSGNRAIHYAAAYGWYFCLKALLDAGAAPDPPNDWKLTPLGASFLKGNQGLTQVLINIPGVNIDFQDEEGKTLVHHALAEGELTEQVLKDIKLMVVEKKANVKLVDKQNRNAFHYLYRKRLTCESDYTLSERESYLEKKELETRVLREITDILLERGCDPWARDNSGENVFTIVLNKPDDRRNLDLLEYLMKKGIKMEDMMTEKSRYTLLHQLVENLEDAGCKKIMKMINGMEFDGKRGSDWLKSMAKERNEHNGFTPFIRACYSYSQLQKQWQEEQEAFEKRIEVHRELLEFLIVELQSELEYEYKKKLAKDVTRTWRITALKALSDSYNNTGWSAFNMVLKHGANIDFRLDGGSTLLLKTMQTGDIKKTRALLDAGANINIKTEEKDQGEMTPLLVATSCGHSDLITLLLLRGADTKAIRTDTKETVLHLAIQHIPSGRVVGVLKRFLEKGANINAQDGNLRTPLHLAANISTDSADESKELEQYLLKSGADPFIKDRLQRLPLHYIFVKWGRHTASGMTDPVESYTIFSMAMKHQHLDDADKFGQTVLHRAAYRGATVCAMLLIQRGCNINCKDNDGNTPIAYAVWNKHDSCAITLIQKDADINTEIITDPQADVHPDLRKKKKKKKEAVNGPVDNDSDSNSDSDDMEVDKDIHKVIRSNIHKITEKPEWKIHPRHFKEKWKPGQRGFPIFQGLVINGWQGVTFLAMDILEKFGMEYAAAVEIALVLGKFRFALKLLNKQLDNEKLRVKNEKKQTLLHILAKTALTNNFNIQEKVLEDLLEERKVDINEQDENGSTAMHFAVLGHHWELARYLLDKCRNLNLQIADKFGRTPLALFQWDRKNHSNHTSRHAMADMMKRGANADILVDYPPTSVIRRGYLPHVDSSEYYQPYSGRKISPLIKAIVDQNTDIIKNLLDNGASPNFPDSEGVTPLMYAVQTGNLVVLHHLFDSNFDIVAYNRRLDTEQEAFKEGHRPLPVPSDDDLFAGSKPLKKTRDINVNAVDHQGRTAVHHLLLSLPCGTYTDLTVLKMIHEAGAKVDVKDKAGKTPLNVAMEQRAVNMAKGIQSLLGVSKNNWQIPSFRPFLVDDGIAWEEGKIDFTADAEAEIKVMEGEEAKKRQEEPWHDIDSRLSLPQGEIVVDEEIDFPCDILMTKVDVKIGEYGLYNFYKMQVIHDKDKDMHILYNCWGRIGDEGQFQKTPMKSAEEAKEEFAKIFKAKSGNEWKDVKNFEIKPRRYRLVDADHRRKNKQQEVKFDLSTKLPSKLPSYIQDLLMDLSNVSMLRSTMSRTRIDIPFGRLKKDVLLKARDILHELHGLTEKLSQVESCLTTENLEEYRELNEQIAEQSSEFYYLVPLRGYAYESLEPLKTKHQVESYIDTLTQLLELQYVGAILLGAQHRIKEMNPLDYIYRAIKTRIQMMPHESPESQSIIRYVLADYVETHPDIEAIYRIERQGEPERLLETNVDNHHLLWHGSRTSNLLGILSRGLLIAPKDAPMSGMRFGKGIYTADTFTKSSSYCYNDGGGRSKYMLLCEAALGKSQCMDRNQCESYPPSGYDSVIGNGENIPDPQFHAMLPTGATIPLGPIVTNCKPYDKSAFSSYRYRSSHNEFIVYNEDQVCLRYIIQFR